MQSSQSPHSQYSDHPHLSALVPALCVFAGGVLGTAIRTALSLAQPASIQWPWVTFAINCAGACILGFLLEYLSLTGKDEGKRKLFRLFVGTGVMGGFTTYGTFILEVDSRVLAAHAVLGIGYAVVSIALGLVMAGLGIALAHKIAASRTARTTRTAHTTHASRTAHTSPAARSAHASRPADAPREPQPAPPTPHEHDGGAR